MEDERRLIEVMAEHPKKAKPSIVVVNDDVRSIDVMDAQLLKAYHPIVFNNDGRSSTICSLLLLDGNAPLSRGSIYKTTIITV